MKYEDCDAGQRVAHITCGDGVITVIENGEVCVIYDRVINGERVRGRYDRNWFRIHPKYLFHRNAEPVQ